MRKTLKVLEEQFNYIMDGINHTDPWLAAAYHPVIKKMRIILKKGPSTKNILKIKEILHIVNSSVSYTNGTGAHENDVIDDSKLFNYLYSVINLLEEYTKLE